MKRKAILKCGDNEIYPVLSADTVLVKAGENNFMLNEVLAKMGNDIQFILEHLGLDNTDKKKPDILFPFNYKYVQHDSDSTMFHCTVLANDYEGTNVYYKISCNAISGVGLNCYITDGQCDDLTLKCKAHVNGVLKNVPLILNNDGNGFELTNKVIWFSIITGQVGQSFINIELCDSKTNEVIASSYVEICVGQYKDESVRYIIAPISPIETIDEIKEDYLSEVEKINDLISIINDFFDGISYPFMRNHAYSDSEYILTMTDCLKNKFINNAFRNRFSPADQHLIELIRTRIDLMLEKIDNVIAQLQDEYDNEENNTFEFLGECEEFIQECGARVEYDNKTIFYTFVIDSPNDFISNNLGSFATLVTIMNTVRNNLSDIHTDMLKKETYTSNSDKINEGYAIIDNLRESKKKIIITKIINYQKDIEIVNALRDENKFLKIYSPRNGYYFHALVNYECEKCISPKSTITSDNVDIIIGYSNKLNKIVCYSGICNKCGFSLSFLDTTHVQYFYDNSMPIYDLNTGLSTDGNYTLTNYNINVTQDTIEIYTTQGN